MSDIKSRPVDKILTTPLSPRPRVADKGEDLPQDRFRPTVEIEKGGDAASAGTAVAPAPTVQALSTPPTKTAASPSAPLTLGMEEPPATPDSHDLERPLLTGPLGPGFPAARPAHPTRAQRLHDFLANKVTGPYNWVVDQVLERISDVTAKGVGVDVGGLLQVERTLYQSMAPSNTGYLAGANLLFDSLANGQAAYVNLGPERVDQADDLMRMFDSLPLATIEKMPVDPKDPICQVRQKLLDRAKVGEFPVVVSLGGDVSKPETATESIATESIASIARRENHLGDDFPDPRMYYRWLLTRVESAYRKLDPWLSGVNAPVHDGVGRMKVALTPPWLQHNTGDPFGSSLHPKQAQKAYHEMMKVCGDGQPPTWETLAGIADATVGLDRDLLTGIQTYLIKLFREISPAQRESLMAPISRAWVNLNAAPPGSPGWELTSPDYAPYLDLIEKGSGNKVQERYDRAMATSQAVDHILDGLGIVERRKMLDMIMKEAVSKQPEMVAREARLREALGPSYNGLDVAGILSGAKDLSDPDVVQGLAELKKVAQPPGGGVCEMTPLHADIIRHRNMMNFIAGRFVRYGDSAFKQVYESCRAQDFASDPLMLGEFYVPPAKPGPVTPLGDGPTKVDILGKPVPGKAPVKMSLALEGGGGKGMAYPEVLRQIREGLDSSQGQVAIDEFVGNSAGALTAGLLAGGYSPAQLGDVMQQLDFKKFYSDYLWLEGGVDPKARGIDRTGLFSQQKMYQTLSDLLKAKTPVEGRPVLFRDLPFKLKVTSTVLNTDISDELRQQLGVKADGQITFSTENTPNMDVAAALCCSAAVPGFFNAPQVQLCQQADRSGEPLLNRMQLVDGGTVNNFPIAEAGGPDDRSFLVNLPAYSKAPPTTPGGQPVELSTLDFGSSNLGPVNAFNRERYQSIKPALGATIQKVAEQGYDRVVVGLNLTHVDEQPLPILQGRTREETEEILQVANQVGLPHASAKDGAETIRGNLEAKKPSIIQQAALNALLDKGQTFKPGFFHAPKYTPQRDEANGLAELVAGVMAARMTAPSHLSERLFENA